MKTIYCIPNLDQIDKYIEFSEEYNAGFEYNDFFLPDVLDQPGKIQKLVKEYKKIPRDRSEDTLHGVFLDICVNSSDALIYKASDFRIHQSMNIASELGVKAVIFHTNQIPNFRLKSYMDTWVDKNEIYWRVLLKEYSNLEIYLENMFDMDSELLRKLAERMADEPRFGVCLDVAHANISTEPVNSWLCRLSPYIRHFHLNDNNGIEDSHNPIGSMTVDWKAYERFTSNLTNEQKPTVLIEVRSFEDLEASIDYMKIRNMYPFTKT